MKEPISKKRVCPKCHREFFEHPSLSRIDNRTEICPDCGTREALSSIGIDLDEQEAIIRTIHNSTNTL